jgi:hypothetical protein
MSIDKDVTKMNWDELLRAFGNSAENKGNLRQEIDRRIARLEKIEAAAKELRRRSDIGALDDAIKS